MPSLLLPLYSPFLPASPLARSVRAEAYAGCPRRVIHKAMTLVWLLASLAALGGCDALSALRSGEVGVVAVPGNPLQGQRLLAQYQCGSCHVIPGVPASRGTVGPPLAAFGSRTYIAGHIPNRNDVLARFIMAPGEVVPGTPMPSMGVSSFDARDIVAYLGTLR